MSRHPPIIMSNEPIGPRASRVDRNLLFASIVAAADFAATSREPWRRPLGWLTFLTGLLGALWGYVTNAHGVVGLVVWAAAGMVGIMIVVFVLAILVETIAARRAEQTWLERYGTGWACAMVRRTSSGEWLLKSMAAWPLGKHAGDQLLHIVCAAADDAGETITLSPSTSKVGNWYSRHGFTHTGKSILGTTMTRAPGSKIDCKNHYPADAR